MNKKRARTKRRMEVATGLDGNKTALGRGRSKLYWLNADPKKNKRSVFTKRFVPKGKLSGKVAEDAEWKEMKELSPAVAFDPSNVTVVESKDAFKEDASTVMPESMAVSPGYGGQKLCGAPTKTGTCKNKTGKFDDGLCWSHTRQG